MVIAWVSSERAPGSGWELDLADGVVVAEDDGVAAAVGWRRRTRWALTALVAGLLLLGAGWGWDQERRSGELDALLTCVTGGQSSIGYAERRVAGITQYVSSSLTKDLPAATRNGIHQLISGAAGQSLPGLRQAARSCREVSPLPWHGELRAARQAYLAHLDAQIAVTEAISRDAMAAPPDRDQLATLARRARTGVLVAAGAGTATDRVRAADAWGPTT